MVFCAVVHAKEKRTIIQHSSQQEEDSQRIASNRNQESVATTLQLLLQQEPLPPAEQHSDSHLVDNIITIQLQTFVRQLCAKSFGVEEEEFSAAVMNNLNSRNNSEKPEWFANFERKFDEFKENDAKFKEKDAKFKKELVHFLQKSRSHEEEFAQITLNLPEE